MSDIKVTLAGQKHCPYAQGRCKNEACMFWKVARQNYGTCLIVDAYKLNTVPDMAPVREPESEEGVK